MFWMHNWKWINLSKMAGLNINRRQRSSDKEHNLSSFFAFRFCSAGSLQFTSSTVKQTKLFHSNFRDIFHLFTRKTLREKLFSLNVCEAVLQQTRTQSLFMCFWGERRLWVRLRRARSHGRVGRKNSVASEMTTKSKYHLIRKNVC